MLSYRFSWKVTLRRIEIIHKSRFFALTVILLGLAICRIPVADDNNSYTVKSGDTACGIAERHGIPCSRLIKKNNLGDSALIYPGQVLRLPDSALWNDSMPCQLKAISWVSVTIEGQHLADHKTEFEKLVRQRLRNEVPSLSHEVKEYGSLWSEVSYDESTGEFRNVDVAQDERFIRRGEVNCRVWTAGTDDPIAMYVSCELAGWGNYDPATFDEFKLEALGSAAVENIKSEADKALNGVLMAISTRLLEHREKDCPATLQ